MTPRDGPIPSCGGLFAACMERFPEAGAWAFHAHDTGLGLANVHAAYRQGVRVFDASFGGLGGPFAPGATGNVATEDVVWMLERMGVPTGSISTLLSRWLATARACRAACQVAACATRSRRSQRPVQPNPCRSCHERRHKALRMSDHAYSHTQSRGRLYDGSITRRSCGLDGADEQFGFGPAAHAQAGGYPSKVVTMVVPAAPGVPQTLPRG